MWENVFEPACAAFGIVPVRADKISDAGEIPEQIFTYLRDADIVIADVTGGNANVMYELGLRHTRDLATIQIGEHERLPFDVNTIRTIKFRRSEAGLIDARNTLIESLRTALEGGGRPVSATRLWNELETQLSLEAVSAAAALSFTSDDPADVLDAEAPGRLDLLAAGEEALSATSVHLGNFTETIGVLGQIMTEATPAITEADSFNARLTHVKQLSDALTGPADQLDATSGDYLKAVEDVDAMMGIIIGELEDDPGTLAESEVKDFVDNVLEMCRSVEEANLSFTEGLAGVREMRKVSNLLKVPTKSLEHSLNTILRGNAIVLAWGERLREVPGVEDGSA
jgi:hypothetical protein